METQPRLYAKGVRKRQEILDKSLTVIAEKGFGETTLRDIADAVNLSQAGVLHYFPSSDDLYLQIVNAREHRRAVESLRQAQDSGYIRIENNIPVVGPEDSDDALYAMVMGFIVNMRNAERTEGLIELFIRMQALASSPSNPAHEYFLRRTALLHKVFEPFIAEGNRRGLLTPQWDPAIAITTIIAMADGLELQWVRDHNVDICGTLEHFFTLAVPGLQEWKSSHGIGASR
ncbi:TetR/AcrR family transcriptional regulator [uncultured Bifidobacterium sp.]|uniref:TetR/AcrR family transcriptional regulator n=1 Tax=uncultured Bifidobacterium sp. TaxID=165187 RepID=UPI00260C218A|nr:TetR/AcrR family transcriptional regulator [uncultured Bifidobacterium sp.]